MGEMKVGGEPLIGPVSRATQSLPLPVLTRMILLLGMAF